MTPRKGLLKERRYYVPKPFRKRDSEVTVEAAKLTPENVKGMSFWSGGIEVVEIDPLDEKLTFVALNIPTVDGPRRVSEGDYVIRNKDGDFCMMNGRSFEFLYEES